MKMRTAMVACVAGLALMSTGCLQALVSNPNAAQAFLSQRLDMLIGGAADWALWFVQTQNTIDTVLAPVLG